MASTAQFREMQNGRQSYRKSYPNMSRFPAGDQFVFHALQLGELDKHGGLCCGNPASTASKEDAVLHYYDRPSSRYICCTKNRFVALFLAEELLSFSSSHKICCIDLSKLQNSQVHDVCSGAGMSQLGKQFAETHQIVLIEIKVPKQAIIATIGTTQWAGALRRNRTLHDYMLELPIAISIAFDKWLQNRIPPVVWNKGKDAQEDDLQAYARGTFKAVRRGHYVSGKRAGHPVVFKHATAHSHVGDEIFWLADTKAIEKAIDIAVKFNRYMRQKCHGSNVHVWMSAATVWSRHGDDCKVLAEPYINSSYRKFNSNSGQESNDDVCKALSHFSYSYSAGAMLLCDLQGGQWRSKNRQGRDIQYYVLTDPALLSQTKRAYGPTDLGQDGIDNFMYYHKCGAYCDVKWRRCDTARPVFAPKDGTSVASSSGELIGTVYLDSSRGRLARREPLVYSDLPRIGEDEEEEQEQEEDKECLETETIATSVRAGYSWFASMFNRAFS